MEPQRLANGALSDLFDHILMFWTGHQRDSSSVLAEQKANTGDKIDPLRKIREHVYQLQQVMSNGHWDFRAVGCILDKGWQLKRQLANTITTDQIDTWYHQAREAGAVGGKLCGAGGGGFLLFVVSKGHQDAVRRALGSLREVPVGPEVQGSQVLFVE